MISLSKVTVHPPSEATVQYLKATLGDLLAPDGPGAAGTGPKCWDFRKKKKKQRVHFGLRFSKLDQSEHVFPSFSFPKQHP